MEDLSTIFSANYFLNGWVKPDYSGSSLTNVSNSICRWLDVPERGLPLAPLYHQKLDGEYRHILLFVVDGLGLKTLKRLFSRNGNLLTPSARDDLLADATLFTLTSVSPSTTAAALTSLWTGSAPAEHGIVGYEVWLKEYSLVANMIRQSPVAFWSEVGSLGRAGFDAGTFVPVQPLSAYLKLHQVQTTFLIDAALAQSGLTVMHMPDARVQPYFSLEDARLTLNDLFAQQAGQKTFTAVYWSLVDTLMHRYGPEDERIDLELERFFYSLLLMLKTLQKKYGDNTLVLLTADHGGIDTPVDAHFDLKNHPDLNAMLTMQPIGESRLPNFFVRLGNETRFLDYMQAEWGDAFTLIPGSDFLATGILGDKPFHHELLQRLGDWVAIPQDGAYLWWKNHENHMLGRHGGLSPEEMLVPLLGWRI